MYLICFELCRNGFVLGGVGDYDLAWEIVEKTFDLITKKYSYDELEYLEEFCFEYKFWYRINGNMKYIERGSIVSDGFTTGHIFDLDDKDFNLMQFIGERMNSSFAFELEEMMHLNTVFNNFSDEIIEFNDLCDSLYLPNSLTNHQKYYVYAN